jgi:hypothetical protein
MVVLLNLESAFSGSGPSMTKFLHLSKDVIHVFLKPFKGRSDSSNMNFFIFSFLLGPISTCLDPDSVSHFRFGSADPIGSGSDQDPKNGTLLCCASGKWFCTDSFSH